MGEQEHIDSTTKLTSPFRQDIKQQSNQKSASNKKQSAHPDQRKGSGGYKRTNPIGFQDYQKINDLQDSYRPHSANIQKTNLIELINQPNLIEANQYQDTQDNYMMAALVVQGYLRKYLAAKKIEYLINEQQIDKNLKLVQLRYQNYNISTSQQLTAQNQSPLRTSYDPNKQKIQILNDNSQNQELSSIISRHSANNFKQLSHFEEEKFSIDLKASQPQPSNNQFYINDANFDAIKKKQEKVQDRIDYQFKIIEQAKQDENQIKNLAVLQSSSSNHRQQAQEESSLNYFRAKDERQRNLNKLQNFDSLSSLNKLSKDYEGEKNSSLSKSNFHREHLVTDPNDESKRDSFFLQVLQKINEQSNQKQNKHQFSIKKDNYEEVYPSGKSYDKQSVNKMGNTSNLSLHSQIIIKPNINLDKTEQREQLWNGGGAKFNQEYSDRSSQILQEESKKQLSSLSVSTQQKSKQIQNKLNLFEDMLDEMTLQTNKGKQKLKKLNDQKHLSPNSQRKRLELEKWVTKQEEKLIKQKKWYMENVDDMISKIDKDIIQTKTLIGSKRSNNSNLFNNSVEMSYDMSINNNVSQYSIHSTPRIVKPMALNEINLPVQNDKVAQKLPFEYKLPDLNEENKPAQIIHRTTLQSERSTDPIVNDMNDNLNQSSIVHDQSKHNISALNQEENKEKDKDNIFSQNLASQNEMSINLSHINLEEDSKIDNDTSSLSQMDPPHFQSPVISSASPNAQQNDFGMDEEEHQQTQVPVPNGLQQENIIVVDQHLEERHQIKDIQVHNDFDIDQKLAELNYEMPDQVLSRSLLIHDTEDIMEEQKSLEEAFSALKEPEQPLDQDKVKNIGEIEIPYIEEQTEYITDYILQALVEQIRYNMYPKRAYIDLKSPKKSQVEIKQEQNDSLQNEANSADPSLQDIVDEPIQVETDAENAFPKHDIKEEDQKPKLRGIKTTIRIVDNYVAEIFKKIKKKEDVFVENLSTPLNKDPLEILLHLQNVYIDSDMETAMAFQQSVLPVDLYLKLERKKQFVQKVDISVDEEPTNKSMLAEWENIHNKVIFDGINEAFDNFRPYGLKGPPMPWSQQTRTLTYKNGQQVDTVLKQVRQKVIEWARTFSGALPCSELLLEYGIRGPLDEDKLNLLREERLALVLASEIEENEMLWTDYEYEETQTKLDVADMILEVLAEEAVKQFNDIKESRQQADQQEDEEIVESQ